MATKVNIQLSLSQTEALQKVLQAAPKQTKTIEALSAKATEALSAVPAGGRKVALTVSPAQADALSKTLAAAPKQTKAVAALSAKVAEAVTAVLN